MISRCWSAIRMCRLTLDGAVDDVNIPDKLISAGDQRISLVSNMKEVDSYQGYQNYVCKDPCGYSGDFTRRALK